LMLMRFV